MNKVTVFAAMCAVFSTLPLKSQQGLAGEYYNGTNFDTPVMNRTDPAIDFDWPLGVRPADGVNSSFFSARWTGYLTPPKSGRYKFSAKVDDGIRVWVGGRKVIDAWGLHDSEHFEGTIELKAHKRYDLKVEYFNDINEGEIHLLWVLPGDDEGVLGWFNSSPKPVEGKYFSRPKQEKPKRETASKPDQKPDEPRQKPKPPAKVPPAKPAEPQEPEPVSPAVLAQKQRELELKPIYFVQSKDEILPDSKKTLDDWVVFLKQKPDAVIFVKGHTDDMGDAQKNQDLSERRARLVAAYFVKKGLGAGRIETKGYGSSQPYFVNPATEKERALNRRVEIRVKR